MSALIVRFEVFTTVEVQVEVFSVMTPCCVVLCCVVVGYQRFGGPYCCHLLMQMEVT
jgi:hypothetical protein